MDVIEIVAQISNLPCGRLPIGPARLKCALLALKGLKLALMEAGVPVSSYVGDDEL